MPQVSVYFASDHAGFDLRKSLMAHLENRAKTRVVDLGCDSVDSVDYPDYGEKLARALKDEPGAYGVLVCGSGIGISIAANRFDHIRAALAHDVTSARLSRAHNDANVLALGARLIGPQVAEDCLDAFLNTEFEGGRHQRRVDKLSAS